VAVQCLSSTDAIAHDYWLEQKPVLVAPGELCSMHLMVGDALTAEIERPFQEQITSRFDWFVGDGVVSLAESLPDSTTPVFEQLVHDAGVSLLVMDRDYVTIEGTVGQFLEFLDHEEQMEIGESYADVAPETPLSRRYRRSIKALLRAGEPIADDLHDKDVGQRSEIRILAPPHSLAHGDEFQVHLTFEGKSLAHQLVRAMVRGTDGTVAVQKAKTDERGIANFNLDRSGFWLIRVAYLQQCVGDCEVDWDTHYAVFSFIHR
jgi:hypothetical protein